MSFHFAPPEKRVRTLYSVCLLPLLTGCGTLGYQSVTYRPTVGYAAPPTGVVIVANGSGDFRTVSTNLCQAVADSGAPLQVETFVWSRGYGRYLADHVDHNNHIIQGGRLAVEVDALKRACPSRPVYLIGHSAGSAVVLAAAEMLPPESIDRIILLAPSVCQTYDLRPALRATRCGIDVFCSSRDSVILGVCMNIVRTADHVSRSAAGRYGFTPIISCPADAALYSKLRQHPWDPALEWTGHTGGHYGSNRAEFLRAYVLPLLATPTNVAYYQHIDIGDCPQ
jgi:pimeloyl-ACP methyl ester carboxylesterase